VDRGGAEIGTARRSAAAELEAGADTRRRGC